MVYSGYGIQGRGTQKLFTFLEARSSSEHANIPLPYTVEVNNNFT